MHGPYNCSVNDNVAALRRGLADRYSIDREIGRGGMAPVVVAQDIRHHRRVAIKVLHPEVAAAIVPERFRREIQIAAQLTHPGILPVLDSGECPTRTEPPSCGTPCRSSMVNHCVNAWIAIGNWRSTGPYPSYAGRRGA